MPTRRNDSPFGHTSAGPVVERIRLVALDRQGRVITAIHWRVEGNVRGIGHVRRDEVDLGGVVRDADLHVGDARSGDGVGVDGGGVVELDSEVDGWVLGPVEVEARDRSDGGEGDSDGLADVGARGLPFRGGGTVDGRERELAGQIFVGRRDGQALRDVSWNGLDQTDLAVAEDDGPIGFELIDLSAVVSDDDWDVGVRKCAVSAGVWGAEPGHGGVGLIGMG